MTKLQVDMRAEVAVLSSNLIIEGDMVRTSILSIAYLM
jgi:hypothetical protein